MYKLDIDKQFDETKNDIVMSLRSVSNKYTLVTELTKSFNIHYHGLIELQGSKRSFVNLFRNEKKIGFVQCNPLYDEEKVATYLSKDLEFNQNELQRRVIINDDYNLFTISQRLKYGTLF